jgi:polynucleotide 5'-hydroxyl-kinase GRC3/NOL9
MHLPAEWQQAADHIVAQARPGLRVMVVGATDTGKSTFCRYLASRLVQAGVEVGLVDADVGQSTVGPPAAISGGLVARSIEASAQVEPAASVFVGSISPMGHLLPCVVGTKRVSDRLEQLGAKAVVVDTSGLILGGAGRALKEHKFDLLQPRVVVALQRDREVEPLIRLWRRLAAEVTVLSPSPALVPRDPAARGRYRRELFTTHFRDGRVLALPMARVSWRNTRLGQGQVLAPQETAKLSDLLDVPVLHGERQGGDALLVVASYPSWPSRRWAASIPGFESATLLPIQQYPGVLCGLPRRDGFLASMAILHRIDFAAGALEFIVPDAVTGAVEVVQVGRVRLDPRGHELGTLRPDDL